MKRLLLSVLSLGFLMSVSAATVTVTGVVTAQPAEAWPRIVRIWCKRDYKRFCRRYKVGSSRMRACMRSHANNLSPVCKKALIDSGIAARYGY